MLDMPALSSGQFSLVYNMFSFTIAAMLAAFIFFIMGQKRVAPKYRISLMVSALVVGIAAYHYIRIFNSWAEAYEITEAGKYIFSGEPFNDAYRYVDWLLTVPLLMVELIMVMNLPRDKSSPLLTKLVIAAALMILLGYPGELLNDTSIISMRGFWGLISTLPFIYILYILWGELGSAIENQPERVSVLLRNLRLLLLLTWGFYPLAYMAPFAGLTGGGSEVAIQVGYSIADVLAKAGYGVMIYAVARNKSEADGWSIESGYQTSTS